ncbi:MAG: type VII toxin-antitoxin system HepT family RNase toxin [Bacillota bacterium]
MEPPQKLNLYLNINLISERISDIKRALEIISKIAVTNKESFLKDEIMMSAAKYQLILAIEAAQNICNHLAARVARTAPTSYADCFRILAENQIISDKLAHKLTSMAKFRNLLVHQYGKIDNVIIYQIISSDTIDLQNYIREIKFFLEGLRKG